MFSIFTILFLFVGILSAQQVKCDIECWLKSLQLIVPDQTITISVGQINITNLVCQNITLGQISSSVLKNQISASLSGISVNCVGNWAYAIFGPLGPSGKGLVRLQLSNSSLFSSIAVIQGDDGLVSTVNLTHCLTKINISEMSFEGGLSGWILDLFSSLIITYTEEAINTQACIELTKLVDTNLTQFIQELNNNIRPYIHPSPPPIPPPVPEGMVNFRDNEVISLMNFVFNNAIGVDGPLGLNKVMNIITSNTGNLTIPGTESMQYTIINPQANVTFGIKTIFISGLNTWQAWNILNASSNFTLSSYTELEDLDLTIPFFLNISLNQSLFRGTDIFEEGTLAGSLRKNRLNSSFQIAMNSSKINSVVSDTDQLTQFSCLLETLYSFNATQTYFNMSINSIILHLGGGSIEKEFDALLSSILQLFITDYSDIVVPFFNGVISGPLREAANQYVYEYIANQTALKTCYLTPAIIPIPIPEGMVNLQESNVVNLTEFIANKVIGANGPLGLNKMINILTQNTGIISSNFNNSLHIVLPLLALDDHSNISLIAGISNVQIKGLNSWSLVDLAVPVQKYLLQSVLQLNTTEVEIDFFLNFSQSFDIDHHKTLLSTDLIGILEATGNIVNSSLELALLENMTHHLMNHPDQYLQLGCLLQALYRMNISSLSLTSFSSILDLSIFNDPVNRKNISLPLDHFVQNIVNGLSKKAKTYLNLQLTEFINNITHNSTACLPVVPITPPPIPKNTTFVDIRENPYIATIQYTLSEVIGANGPSGLNAIISLLTDGLNQFSFSNVSSFNFTLYDSLFIMQVHNITIGGLNQFTNVELLKPIDSYSFVNNISSSFIHLCVDVTFQILNEKTMLSVLDVKGLLNISTKLDSDFIARILLNNSQILSLTSPSPQLLLNSNCSRKIVYDLFIDALDANLNFTSVLISFGDVKKLFDGTDGLIISLEHVIEQAVNGSLRNELNLLLNHFFDTTNDTCPEVPTPLIPIIPSTNDIANLTSNSNIKFINFLTNELIGTEGPLGLNRIVNLISNNTGDLVFINFEPITLTVPLNENQNISVLATIKNIALSGLNNWKNFELFKNKNAESHLLSSLAEIDNVSVNIEIAINLILKEHQLLPFPEIFKLSVHFNDFLLNFATIIGYYKEPIEVFIGNSSYWNYDCLISTLQSLLVNQSSLDSDISSLSLTINNTEFDYRSVLNGLHLLIHSTVSGPLRDFMNQNISHAIARNTTCVPDHYLPPELPKKGMTSFYNNSAVQLVNYFVNDLAGTHGIFNLSYVFKLITNGTGVFMFSDLEQFGFNQSSIALDIDLSSLSSDFPNITLMIQNFSIFGLTSCDKFSLFNYESVSNYSLFSELSFRELELNLNGFVAPSNTSSSSFSTFSTFTPFQKMLSEVNENNTGSIRIKLNNFQLNNSIQLLLNSSYLNTFFHNNPYAWTNVACILASLYNDNSTFLENLGINLTMIELVFDFPHASPPIYQIVNASEWEETFKVITQSALDGPLRKVLNEALSNFLRSRNESCPYYPSSESLLGSVEYFSLYFVIVMFAVFTIVISFTLFYINYLDKKMEEKLKRETLPKNNENINLQTEEDASNSNNQLFDDEEEPGHSSGHVIFTKEGAEGEGAEFTGDYDPMSEDYLLDNGYINEVDISHSLVFNPSLHPIHQYGIPIGIMFTVCMYITANTSIGATVSIMLKIGEESVWVPPTFQFTLMNSVTDMWKAGVYPLSILILLFSGIWPYIKLLLLFLAWFIPPRVLNVKRREYLLIILDVLQKWSLIDAFVLIMMIVAFRLHLQTPNTIGQMDVYIIPGWGFYAFLLATFFTLILSHIELHFHRVGSQYIVPLQVMDDDLIAQIKSNGNINQIEYEDQERSSLALRNKSRDWRITYGRALAVTILLIVSLTLIIVGSVRVAFDFQFGGLTKLVLEFLNYSTFQSYSMLSLGSQIPHSSMDPNDFGIRVIQATFFLFSFTVPLFHIIMLIVLWMVPLKINQQRQIYLICEVANAWAAIEVFVLSLIVALVELEQFALFMVGDSCNFINYVLVRYFPGVADGKCFTVKTSLQNGCWTLIAACVLYIIAAGVVMRVCHRALSKNSGTI